MDVIYFGVLVDVNFKYADLTDFKLFIYTILYCIQIVAGLNTRYVFLIGKRSLHLILYNINPLVERE